MTVPYESATVRRPRRRKQRTTPLGAFARSRFGGALGRFHRSQLDPVLSTSGTAEAVASRTPPAGTGTEPRSATASRAAWPGWSPPPDRRRRRCAPGGVERKVISTKGWGAASAAASPPSTPPAPTSPGARPPGHHAQHQDHRARRHQAPAPDAASQPSPLGRRGAATKRAAAPLPVPVGTAPAPEPLCCGRPLGDPDPLRAGLPARLGSRSRNLPAWQGRGRARTATGGDAPVGGGAPSSSRSGPPAKRPHQSQDSAARRAKGGQVVLDVGQHVRGRRVARVAIARGGPGHAQVQGRRHLGVPGRGRRSSVGPADQSSSADRSARGTSPARSGFRAAHSPRRTHPPGASMSPQVICSGAR